MQWSANFWTSRSVRSLAGGTAGCHVLRLLQRSDTLPGPQMPSISKHMYVCMYACTYVCMYVCSCKRALGSAGGERVSDEDMDWDAFELAIAGRLLLIVYCLLPIAGCLLLIS